MRIRSEFHNFILYLILIALIAAGISDKTISTQKAGTSCDAGMSCTLSAPSCSEQIDLWAQQISGKRPAVSVVNIVQRTRTSVPSRSGVLFFLCILTLLSVFSHSNEKLLAFRDTRYLYRESFTISFMQDADGRKRISYI